MEEDKRSAICLKNGTIRRDYDTGHSLVFMFNQDQIIKYRETKFIISYDYTIWNIKSPIAFPISESEFRENFIDLADVREAKIDIIFE